MDPVTNPFAPGAGTPPQALTGRAKSYAERLFDSPTIGPLPPDAAKLAIEQPLREFNVAITADALDLMVEQTGGHPYFVQEWGKHSWEVATTSPITVTPRSRCRCSTSSCGGSCRG